MLYLLAYIIWYFDKYYFCVNNDLYNVMYWYCGKYTTYTFCAHQCNKLLTTVIYITHTYTYIYIYIDMFLSNRIYVILCSKCTVQPMHFGLLLTIKQKAPSGIVEFKIMPELMNYSNNHTYKEHQLHSLTANFLRC